MITEHAVQLFDKKGYHATSIQDIAKELGCTKAALYYYIDTKSDILLDIHHKFLDTAVQAISTRLTAEDLATDPEKSLREFVRVAVELCENLRAYVKVFHQEMADLNSEQRAQTLRERRAYQKVVQDAIEHAQHEGTFNQKINSRVATLYFFGAINWMYQWYSPSYDGISREDLIDQFVNLAMYGLVGASDNVV